MRNLTLVLLATTAIGFASSSMAADLIIDTPVEAGVVEVGGSWDGVFIGVYGGYTAGDLTGEGYIFDGADISGWNLGVAVGANFTITDGVVAGVVADLGWNDVDSSDFPYTSGWNGSLRARLGLDAGAFLPYVTAGVAFANGEFDGITNTHIGWTAGAGVEFAVTEDVSLDLQYRYTSYGEETYQVPAGATTSAVTVGLNWRF